MAEAALRSSGETNKLFVRFTIIKNTIGVLIELQSKLGRNSLTFQSVCVCQVHKV